LAGQLGIFIGSLGLMSLSSFVLTVALERIGARLQIAEGFYLLFAAAIICWPLFAGR
jgi:hypothetical protein